jgi:hypothetical protein
MTAGVDVSHSRMELQMLRRLKHRAFSLVEFVVAIGVLVFGVYAIYDQFIAARIPSQQRLLMAQGRALAHQRLEELRAAPFDSLKSYQAPEKFEPIESDPRFHCRSKVVAEGIALEITVEVGWHASDEAGQSFADGKLVTVKGLRTP